MWKNGAMGAVFPGGISLKTIKKKIMENYNWIGMLKGN